MESHNGLSARIVEEAGFEGIWASGLSISAAMGVRDSNEASWTQVLEVIEFMSDRTTIPILLDGDTGFGNFNNMRRLVQKLEQRDIAGVCIEDKLFPKTNSFIGGEQQALADIHEFCGKIKAAKDTQRSSDFCVIARVEAFIAGWGQEEALKRATAYCEAGADAILVHSKRNEPDDILGFMKEWNNDCPIVIVPTMYYRTPTQAFEKAGISTVIWANHMLRSSISIMQKAAKQIFEERTLTGIESGIVPVREVFRLQNADELKKAEKVYLPQVESVKGIVLAASKGTDFGILTDDKPKCMLEVFGKTILSRIVKTLSNCRIKDISVVVGYKHKAVNLANLNYVMNKEYSNTGALNSLCAAKDELSGTAVICFGDVLFEERILEDLLHTREDIVLAVDTSWCQGLKSDRTIDAVIGVEPPSNAYLSERCVPLKDIGIHIEHRAASGEWIGLMKVSPKGSDIVRTQLERFRSEDEALFMKASMVDFLKYLMENDIRVSINYFSGRWLDIDSVEDIVEAHRTGSGDDE
jgi:phosphoenolpyruvate phosphomutase